MAKIWYSKDISMTLKGKSLTLKGELSETTAPEEGDSIWHFRNLFSIQGDGFLKRNYQVSETTRVAEFMSKEIYFRHTSGSFPSQQKLVLENPAPFLHMAFCISNSRHYQSAAAEKPFAFLNQHQHNLLLFPGHEIAIAWPQEEQTEFFDIFISTDRFFRYLPQSHPLYTRFRDSIDQNSIASLSGTNLPLTPRIITLLYEILNCQFSGHCKCLFAEAKVVELLALQLDQQEQPVGIREAEGLKAEDVEKMQQAKALLLAHLEKPLTLKDLAHQVGTNEFNLKKHFKEVFGTTVYGYLKEYKMEQSRELLLQGETKIAEVARMMGYKHATHFTSAFKKHFGFLPHKLTRG